MELHSVCPPKSGVNPQPQDVREPSAEAVLGAARRWVAGDVEAGRELLRLVVAVGETFQEELAWYRGASWDQAYDAVIDMALEVYEKVGNGEMRLPERDLRKFLYRCAARCFWKRRRKDKLTLERCRSRKAQGASRPHLPKIVLLPQLPAGLVDPAAQDPAELAEQREFEELAHKAALKLSPRKRRILFARLRGMSYPEIRELLDTGIETARVYRSEAAKALRRHLKAA